MPTYGFYLPWKRKLILLALPIRLCAGCATFAVPLPHRGHSKDVTNLATYCGINKPSSYQLSDFTRKIFCETLCEISSDWYTYMREASNTTKTNEQTMHADGGCAFRYWDVQMPQLPSLTSSAFCLQNPRVVSASEGGTCAKLMHQSASLVIAPYYRKIYG